MNTVTAMMKIDVTKAAANRETMKTVAHDFNNLLTGILGNLELMQMRASRRGITEFDDYLSGTRSAACRAVDLTQRLLAATGEGMAK